MKKIKIIVSLLCVAALMLTAVGCSGGGKIAEITPDYQTGSKCTKTDELSYTDGTLTLTLDFDSCNVTVTENASGRSWSSNPTADYQDGYAAGVNKTGIFSQITVSFVGTSNALENTNSYASSVRKGNYSIYKTQNGFIVEYSFNEGFTIPVEYAIVNGSFEASILYTGIKEEGEDQISTIALLPYFGTATMADNGFLLVPDGSGAVINFNNGKTDSQPYEAKVYGVDESLPNDIVTTRSEQIYVPLIGMQKNDGAYVATITSGAAEATVNAAVAGQNSGFNNIYFEAIYREAQNLSVLNGSLGTAGLVMYASEEPSDIPRFTVKYSFVEKSSPTVGDMVDLARGQMLNDGAIAKTADNASLYVDIYGGVSKQKSIVGIQYTGVETLTTFKQAQQMLSTLKEGGVNNLTVGYKNYSKSYFSGKLMSDLTPVAALGGKKGIKQLYEFAKSNNTDLYFEADFYSFTSGGNGFSKYFDITKALDLGAAEVYPQKINTNIPDTSSNPYFMLKPSHFGEAAQSILKTAEKSGISGVYLGDAANSLSADYEIGGIKRSTATQKAAEAAEALSNKKMLLSSPNYYLWKYMDKATNIPVTSSAHHLFDYDVPLVQMLLKGSVPYSGYSLNISNTNDNSYLLHIAYAQNIHYGFMADDASELQSTSLLSLYGLSDSKLYEASQKAQQFSEFYSLVKDLYIDDYSLSGDLSKTLYSDGTCVLVNFSTRETAAEGVTVPARGWVVVKDGAVITTGGEQQ